MNAEINVTSLVDVAFTLLVIFIITAPMLQGGVEVRLPQANVQPVNASDDMLIVTVQKDGNVFFENTEVSIEEFESGFAQLVQAAGGTQTIFLRGDTDAPYGVILRVVATAGNAGVGVQLIGEPKAPGPRP
jgi:biopolymer transport protein ExbD